MCYFVNFLVFRVCENVYISALTDGKILNFFRRYGIESSKKNFMNKSLLENKKVFQIFFYYAQYSEKQYYFAVFFILSMVEIINTSQYRFIIKIL
jgi:hypothetical protein